MSTRPSSVERHDARPGRSPRASGSSGPDLRTADGVDLATRCWLSETPSAATVVICHGFTASKDDPRVVALAETLHDRGHDVVTYDSRGHGRSGGVCTLGKLEGLDVAAVVEWAGTRGNRVVLVGASMGAVAALAHAAGDHSLAGVVAVSCPGDWRLPLRPRSLLTAGLARTRPGRSWAERNMNVRIGRWAGPESPRTLLRSVRCPVVVMHGSRDLIVPTSFGLVAGLDESAARERVVVSGMGHAFDPIALPMICDAAGRLIEQGCAQQVG